MTGRELYQLRIKSGKTQAKFYFDAGFFPSYASHVENYYGAKQIPEKLEKAIQKKYKSLLNSVNQC
jgi:hypothetical protein